MAMLVRAVAWVRHAGVDYRPGEQFDCENPAEFGAAVEVLDPPKAKPVKRADKEA